MRILLVSTTPLISQSPLGQVGERFRSAGHTILVAAPLAGRESPAQARSRLGAEGFLPLRPGEQALPLLVNGWAIQRWSRALKVPLVCGDSPAAGVLALAARGAGAGGTLVMLMLDRIPPMGGFLPRMLATRSVREADRLFIERPELREQFVALGARRADIHHFEQPAQLATFALATVSEEFGSAPLSVMQASELLPPLEQQELGKG